MGNLLGLLAAAGELTKTWKQAMITLVFVGLLGTGVLGYQFMYKWVEGYHHYEDVIDRLVIDESVQTSMDKFRQQMDADRILVAELHDGKVNMSGVRFGYVSATYEADAVGIAPMVMQMQNLPTSMFAGYWKDLLHGQCVSMSRNEPESLTPTMTAFTKDNRVKNMVVCPVYVPGEKDKLLGISLAMWMDNDNYPMIPGYVKDMQELSLVVSGALMKGRS